METFYHACRQTFAGFAANYSVGSLGDMMRKIILAAAILGGAMAPGAALADSREDVIGGLTRCAALADDRQWLDCYYGAAQPMRAWLGLSPAPQAQLKLLSAQPKPTVLPTTVTRAAVRSGPPPMPKGSGIFGMFSGKDIVNNTPIQTYEVGHDGFTITLPDGQVWQQTDDDNNKNPVRWRQAASSMRVTISQGALSSFNLVLNDENVHHKVTRVR
jgi:hypothetical protein